MVMTTSLAIFVLPTTDHTLCSFGFADGISEPAIAGFNTPLPGQDPIPEGVILLGRDGDATPTRPEWAKDGSFPCFRMLAQRVPEFDAFLSANAIKINDPSAPQDLGKDLLGARMVGRWKSGMSLTNVPRNRFAAVLIQLRRCTCRRRPPSRRPRAWCRPSTEQLLQLL